MTPKATNDRRTCAISEGSVAQTIEPYFFTGERHPEYVSKNRRETIAFIDRNFGHLSLVKEGGGSRWSAYLLGGQDIGQSCLAAYYLASITKIPVQFDANGTRFLISEIG